MAGEAKIEAYEEILSEICTLIEPFNAGKIPLTEHTEISADLDLDSLAVMDLLAAIEDRFDITVPLNMLPELETLGEVATAVEKIKKEQ